jgi:predicted nucleotidyltransferase/DNA-binding transcriptional ArsR family regulator
MDNYKLKFTGLQRDLLEFLLDYPTTKFSERELSRRLKVSPTAVSKAIRHLEKEELVRINKNFMLEIKLNADNEQMREIKRLSNLGKIYSSGLFYYLFDILPGRTIILFGSYAHGEDIESSDIDIAVIGTSPKGFMLKDIEKFEKILNREINMQFFDWGKTDKNLKESIINGIILKGHVEL